MTHSDTLYQDASGHIVDFAFDESVVAVFPDMIRRSVPGYEVVVPLTGLIAAEHLRPGDAAYDLGCSLGASTLAMLKQLGDRDVTLHAVDNSQPMIEQAKDLIADQRVRWQMADITDLHLEPCRVVVMNYTLQFVSEDKRIPLLRRIRDAMLPGGVLLISEKVRYADEAKQAFYRGLHERYKAANGYTEMEIAGKRTALENVMHPDTEDTHRERFAKAGFSQVDTWFCCMNWAAFLVRP